MRTWLCFAATVVAVLASVAPAAAEAQTAPAPAGCGEVVSVATHGRTMTRFAFARPKEGSGPAMVLLAGGEGFLDLDDRGCPRKLKNNSLVRSIPHFHGHGVSTALLDAPSDRHGADGLAGFRIAREHADDLGKVIADVRRRAGAPVWLAGTSRGTISAANAASRLSGPSAPDGLVLTSAVTSGGKGGHKPWAVQTVFSVPLGSIRVPVLVVGHAADKCIRTPASLMGNITARMNGAREQVVTVTGGSANSRSGLEACEALTPHGFLGQEATVAAGMVRFVRGGRY